MSLDALLMIEILGKYYLQISSKHVIWYLSCSFHNWMRDGFNFSSSRVYVGSSSLSLSPRHTRASQRQVIFHEIIPRTQSRRESECFRVDFGLTVFFSTVDVIFQLYCLSTENIYDERRLWWANSPWTSETRTIQSHCFPLLCRILRNSLAKNFLTRSSVKWVFFSSTQEGLSIKHRTWIIVRDCMQKIVSNMLRPHQSIRNHYKCYSKKRSSLCNRKIINRYHSSMHKIVF